jgi:hypothetical protein
MVTERMGVNAQAKVGIAVRGMKRMHTAWCNQGWTWWKLNMNVFKPVHAPVLPQRMQVGGRWRSE